MANFTIKNPYKEQRFFQKRLKTVSVIIVILVVCLISRLCYLQVVEKKLYTTLSNKNQLSLVPVAPTRGLIFDRHGVILAENIPIYSLEIIPNKVKNLPETIAAIEKLIPLSPEDLHEFYQELKQKRPFDSIPLKVKLSSKDVAVFSVNRWRFPGVTIKAQLMRYYPDGKSIAQVVGYVGRINSQELTEVNAANYSDTNFVGKIGVEKYFETLLHGTVGYQQVETDASGRTVRIMSETPPVSGNNIYLTIDSGLEKITEKAFKHQSGAAVAINPNNGQVLALVSYPSYDSNLFVRGISEKNYLKLENAPNQPLYNRAIRGLYAPGSTIKPYYGLEGLASGTITPNTKYYDPGYFKYAGHTYWGWLHSGFGWINLEKSIVVSDDVYFYDLAIALGIDRMDRTLNEFGFGHTSNIEMGEELPGVVPSPAWKIRHIGAGWYTGDTINMGIGQGYLLVTPLQMAQAVAVIAERGKRFQTHLLLKMQLPNGSFVSPAPVALPSVSMPTADWNLIIKAMTEVITLPEGIGFQFGFGKAPYTVAAKTGTAQVYSIPSHSKYTAKDLPKKYQDNSTFIAFAPVNHPLIAISVVAEHSNAATKIARKMLDYYLVTTKHWKPNEQAANQPNAQNTNETTN